MTGTPRPTVAWSKLEGGLPRSAEVNDVFLVIPEVTVDEAGTYVCTAENLVGRVEQRVTLYVRGKLINSTNWNLFLIWNNVHNVTKNHQLYFVHLKFSLKFENRVSVIQWLYIYNCYGEQY